MLVVAKATGPIFHYYGHGVWVPAFAGTTEINKVISLTGGSDGSQLL
jgi:hypothetical protein